jgi:transcriptional regulator with XRE-family HTH domain
VTDDFDIGALGRRIRSIRLGAGLSVDAVARQSGVSRSMVAAVEGGEKAPTVLTLHRIANGLGTNMTRLLGEETQGDVIVLRQRDQRVARDPSGWERRNLTPALRDSTFEFMRTTIPPGVDAGVFPPHRPGTREVVAVESGTLLLTIDGTPWHVGSGDSIIYRGDVLHQFTNPGDVACVYYLTLHQDDESRRLGAPVTVRADEAETVDDPLWNQAVEAIRDQHWVTVRTLETSLDVDSRRAMELLARLEREHLVRPDTAAAHLAR